MLLRALRLIVALWLGLMPMLVPHPARADAFSSCTFAISEVTFGPINVLPGSAISSSGIMTVRCPALATLLGTTLYVCVAFPTPRRMQGPSATLTYDFLGPLPATTSWSSATPIQVPLSLLLSGGSATVTIPAAVLASQSATPPGLYTSTVTATVTYGLLGCTLGTLYSTTTSFQVDTTVVSACNVSAQPIAFGSTGLLTAALDAQGQLTAQCTSGTGYTIGLDGGLTGATDPTQRQMLPAGGPGQVTYGLYQNAGRSVPWGDTAGANAVAGTGTALSQVVPVYARIPAQPTPAPGSYSDTVVLTISY